MKCALMLLAVFVFCTSAMAQESKPAGVSLNKLKIVQANIIATHAYQVLLAQAAKDGNPDKDCWNDAGLSKEQLQALVDHQAAILNTPPEEIAAWAAGKPSKFDPAKDLEPILKSPLKADGEKLPVNVLSAYICKKFTKGQLELEAVVSLAQMITDVERDGDKVQQMYVLYKALDLPLYLGEMGVADKTDEELLAFGKEIAPKLCKCPFAATPEAMQILGRKMHNWGQRYAGIRDKTVLAKELLAEKDVQALLPAIQKMPAQKIAVIGHSFTMDVHWASPSAFVPVVGEMLRLTNPKVEVRQWQAGGLSAVRAYSREKFYEQALAWKPDRVLLVLADSGQENQKAMQAMIDGFTSAGIEVMTFDRLWPARPTTRPTSQPASAVASAPPTTAPAAKPRIIEVGQVLAQSPDREKFIALDGIHMTEPYHRLMAKEWLKFLCGARKEKLGD